MQLHSSVKLGLLSVVFLGSTLNGMGRHRHSLPVIFTPHHSSQAQELGKAALVVGCVAAVGYGLYKLGSWLFSKTDVQVLQEAQQANGEAEKATRIYVAFFENKWGEVAALDHTHKRQIMHTLDEALLYQFAVAHALRTSVEHTILSTLSMSLSNAKSAHEMVIERVHKLRKKHDITGMITQLESVQQALEITIARIEFVHEYLNQHRSYYTLLVHEYGLMKNHEYELLALAQYGQSPTMKEALRVAVMRHADSRMTYPYMNYIQKMQRTIGDLDYQINALSCHYPERMAAARNLLTQLNVIYNMLIIEDAYRQELRDYERAQLEKQRIEAEQAKAAAAQAAAHAAQVQANAMQQQAYEMQKQNQLYAQQNQLQAEQNAILTAQVIVDAVNPKPQPQIHIYN